MPVFNIGIYRIVDQTAWKKEPKTACFPKQTFAQWLGNIAHQLIANVQNTKRRCISLRYLFG